MSVGIDGVNPISPNNPAAKAVHPDDRVKFAPAVVEPEPAVVEEPEAPVGTPQDGTVVAEGESEPIPAAPEAVVETETLPVNPDIEVIVPVPDVVL